jgi:hypothetical protein
MTVRLAQLRPDTENIALVIYSGETDHVKSVEIVDIEPPLEKVA